MDEPKAPGEEVVDVYVALCEALLRPEHVGNGRYKNGDRYKEFDPGGAKPDYIQGSERQGDRMADGKRSYKNEDFLPVTNCVHGAERYYEQDVVVAMAKI